jgi:hypothetical protein
VLVGVEAAQEKGGMAWELKLKMMVLQVLPW